MRKLLLLALLLYNILAWASRPNSYDYDELDGSRRHALVEDRRNWRKKTLMKPEVEHKEWDDRRRYDYESPRYYDDLEIKGGLERQREPDSHYKRRFDDVDAARMGLAPNIRSGEQGHPSFLDKENEKKGPYTMSCDKPHERFEACFAGCASVTCDNPRDRLRPCYPFCEAGCVCVQPYVRDDRTHKCILPEDCTRGLKGIPDLADET